MALDPLNISPPILIGLTGGIGSGKSTATKMFAALGVPVLDLDTIGRKVLNEPHIQQALISAFGMAIQNNLGAIDRKVLAKIVFSDATKTTMLNQIMHPEILRHEQRWVSQQTAPYTIIEASVLLESGSCERMDGVIVVFANEALRKARVLSRGKQSETVFENIKLRQCNDDTRRKYASHILSNEGTLESLKKQVLLLSNKLSEQATTLGKHSKI